MILPKKIKRLFYQKLERFLNSFKMGLGLFYEEEFQAGIRGDVFFSLVDSETGEELFSDAKKNIITKDLGLLLSRLLKDPLEPKNGINMLAVGTGANGNLLSPDAPDNRQRRLNAEIFRKPFSSITWRDSTGAAVSYPTNIIDFTATFGQGEAVGPLNEMALVSTISSNNSTSSPNPASFPTYDTSVDVTVYDILANYLTFGVISKPSNSILTITWRLTV